MIEAFILAVTNLGIWFSGAGVAIISLGVPALVRVTRNYRNKRENMRELPQVDHEARIKALEEGFVELGASIREVLVFIKGSEDPFTHQISGGLLATLARLEERLK